MARPLHFCHKEQIAKDLLSGEEEEETQSSADDLTPSVTSHEASDLFPGQNGCRCPVHLLTPAQRHWTGWAETQGLGLSVEGRAVLGRGSWVTVLGASPEEGAAEL